MGVPIYRERHNIKFPKTPGWDGVGGPPPKQISCAPLQVSEFCFGSRLSRASVEQCFPKPFPWESFRKVSMDNLLFVKNAHAEAGIWKTVEENNFCQFLAYFYIWHAIASTIMKYCELIWNPVKYFEKLWFTMKYHEMHEKIKTRGNKMGGSIGEGMGLAMLPPMLFQET